MCQQHEQPKKILTEDLTVWKNVYGPKCASWQTERLSPYAGSSSTPGKKILYEVGATVTEETGHGIYVYANEADAVKAAAQFDDLAIRCTVPKGSWVVRGKTTYSKGLTGETKLFASLRVEKLIVET